MDAVHLTAGGWMALIVVTAALVILWTAIKRRHVSNGRGLGL